VKRRVRALWRERRADVGALVSLALFFVAFFPQALFGGKYLLANDAFFYSYPLRTVAWRMLRSGELPLWTPYIQSGYPLLSMAQIGLAYPLTWGYLFLPGHVAEQIYVLAPFLLIPAFTYTYLRHGPYTSGVFAWRPGLWLRWNDGQPPRQQRVYAECRYVAPAPAGGD